MNILLIFPPIRENDVPRNFPTGMGLIAATLKNAGYNVTVWDVNGWRYSKEDVLEKIKHADFDVVGMGGLIPVYRYVKWLVPHLKERNPNCKIVLGGPVGTYLAELVLTKNPVDVIVDGEGENTILDLVAAYSKGRGLNTVSGIYYKDEDGNVNRTPAREVVQDLDTLPFPAWDMFPMEETYMKNPVVGLGRDMDVISSRGCPYLCTFCAPSFGRKYRYRSPEHVLEEIRQLKKLYDVDFISFQDDLFVTNRQRVFDFCEALIRSELFGKIKWSCTGRVNLVDEPLLRAMKDSGCVSVSFGIESGSQYILDSLKKAFRVEQAVEAIGLCEKLGLRHPSSFIIGSPMETTETLEETVQFAIRANVPVQALMINTPYPGTPLFYEALKKGKITDLEPFVMSLGDALDMTVNLSEIPDKELLRLRDEMIAKINANVKHMTAEEKLKRDLELYGEALLNKGLEQMKQSAMSDHRRKHGFNEETVCAG